TGVASVAWHSRIMPIRVTDASGFAYASTIVNGLTWAVDHGAKVMNISIGGVAGSSAITSAAQYVRSRGGVVVASAGNCGCFDATPANPYIISVSATDQTDSVTSWSSQGNYVDIAAPGNYIYTTARGGGYQYTIGTSFSSPIVAGVVALMMAVNPSLSPTELANLLTATADDKSLAGWDPAYGFGRVNAYRAVAAAAAAAVTAPAPTADTTPPVVAISGPANGATVAGTITVAAVASDDTGVAKVELYLDGILFATDTASPYTFSWNTAGQSNGMHALTAKAYDAAGNLSSVTVNVSVNNVVDTTPPTVTITSVTQKDKSHLLVKGTASDDVKVTRVELYVDGSFYAKDGSTPYQFTIDLNRLSIGAHVLTLKAYDAAGNV